MKLIEASKDFLFIAAGNVVLRVNKVNDESVQLIRHDKTEDSHVVSMTITPDGQRLFVGYSNKIVSCWEMSTMENLGTATLRKQPTAVQYGSFLGKRLNRSDNSDRLYEVLLASDKAGEVYALDAPAFKRQSLLAGHTASVITDMAIHTSQNGRTLVATSDRDEKVRISHFPDLENICTFCLAHTNVVASVCFLELSGKVLLLSTGWDHTLRLWDASNGTCIQTVSFRVTEGSAGINEKPCSSSSSVGENNGNNSSSAAPAAEEGPLGADIDLDEAAVAENEENEDDPEGKVYDEFSAGDYPFKVACSPSGTVAAVLFKNKAVMKLFSVVLENSSTGVISLTETAVVSLPANGVDVAFTGEDEVSVVVPKPHGLCVFSVVSGQARDVSTEKAHIAKLVASAESLGKK